MGQRAPTNAEQFSIGIEDIRGAAEQIAGQVLRTPLLPSPRLSELTGAEVWVKYENMQATGSFKERGALVKLESLTPQERKQGVITMSAGNHAQAVAYHAARLGIPAVIVMPETTPYVKVGNTEAFGAEVLLVGGMLAASAKKAESIATERDLTLIHPYDDPLVMAGQGTIALEVLEDTADLDCLVIQIGGGGLIAGNAIALKALRPDIEIIGAESALFPSMYQAVRGEQIKCGGQTLAEGIAVKQPGSLTLPVVEALVSDIILVDENQLERAITLFATHQKTIAEGAGAAGLAAMLAEPERFAGKKVGLYLCGGNIDPRMLTSLLLRALERDGKIVSLRIAIDDRPGVLGAITSLLGEEHANILQVSHSRLILDMPAKDAMVEFIIETKDAAHSAAVLARLESEGFAVTRLEGHLGADISL